MGYTKEQLAALSGDKEQGGGAVGGNYFDTLTLGKDGKYYLAYYSQPKDERDDPDVLGEEVKLTIIKIRRKINKWVEKTNVLESVEYDAGVERVATTAGDISEKEAKGQGGKVSLVAYALKDGKVVKFAVSGGSLYNPDDEENMRLYSYLQSFADDEHTFMFETILGAKENKWTDDDGFETTNYQMTFKRGKALKSLEEVGAKLTELAEQLPENDARDLKFLGKPKGNKKAQEEETDAVEGDSVDPNTVPF